MSGDQPSDHDAHVNPKRPRISKVEKEIEIRIMQSFAQTQRRHFNTVINNNEARARVHLWLGSVLTGCLHYCLSTTLWPRSVETAEVMGGGQYHEHKLICCLI